MKKSIFSLSLILILLASTSIAFAATVVPDPNRPSTPSNEPILQAPYNDTSIDIPCSYGCGNHTDNSNTIKTYYAQDYEKIGSDGLPVPFDVIATGDGTIWGLGTTDGKLTNIVPQPECPVDANLSNDTPTKHWDANMVYIDHGNHWYSFYLHMDKVYVTKNGQQVKAGDVIGTAGCTGAQTIHLHYDLRWQDPVTKVWWDYPPNFSPAPTNQKGVDLAFAIDTTGSMGDDIASAKSVASDIVDTVFAAAPDSRFALLDFRDFPERTGSSYDYPYHDDLAFTRNKNDAKTAINALSLGDGGDTPETRNCALMHAFNADTCAGKGAKTSIGPWRPIPAKFLVYLTDAPALNPEPFTNFTDDNVAAAAKAGGFEVMGGDGDPTGYPDVPLVPNGIAVYPIVVGGDSTAIAEANAIATETGGRAFTVANASEVSDAIIQAIQTILNQNQPPVLTYPTVLSGQYSDNLAFTASAIDPDNAGNTLVFSAQGFPDGLTLTDNQDGTTTISGILQVGPGSYKPTITVTDPSGLADSKPMTIVVNSEDARATYTGPMLISTANAKTSKVTVPLRATIQDITAVSTDPAYDQYPGDITHATVSFVDRGNSNKVLCTSNVALIASDSKTGTASCNWPVDIGPNNGLDYTVGIMVDGYYARNSADDDTVVIVSKPDINFVAGGGFLVNQSSGGKYSGDAKYKSSFGLMITYIPKKPNLTGRVTLMVRHNGHLYWIRTTSLTSLVADPYYPKKPTTGVAELLGKATIIDVTNWRKPVVVATSANLQIAMKDNGEPGKTDTLSISLWDKSGILLYSSNWNGAKTNPQTLSGGNLIVH